MRTEVAIVGAGPAGLLLSLILHAAGIEAVVLERRDRAYVEGRIRAGILEETTVGLMERLGVAGRLHAEAMAHDGFGLVLDGKMRRIDLAGLTGGRRVTVYGQTEVTRDLIAACAARGQPILWNVAEVALHDLDGPSPYLTFARDGRPERLDCAFVAGCDGFHGASRSAVPEGLLRTFERVYPFCWLGILADAPPLPELVYSNHERGFALASMRSPSRSRYYLQCRPDERLEDWPDERIWDELSLRLGPEAAAGMTRAPSIETSIARLRSFVCEPMRHGRLFLAGDAAHIVPPTGAKGLNLAASDVAMLGEALVKFYRTGRSDGLDGYSDRALARVWKAERFSGWFTGLTHRFPDMDPFDRRMQAAEIEYIFSSRAAQTALAENYLGLPLA